MGGPELALAVGTPELALAVGTPELDLAACAFGCACLLADVLATMRWCQGSRDVCESDVNVTRSTQQALCS